VNRVLFRLSSSLLLLLSIALFSSEIFAQGLTLPNVNLGFKSVDNPQDMVSAIKVLLILTVLTLAPAILIMMTSFTRIVIVLSFVRQAIGTQQMPPNQLVVGLSLFLTLFVMSPALTKINSEALQPYMAGTLPQDEALDKALSPLRQFMFNQTRDADLSLFVKMARIERPKTRADVPTTVLVPAFVISELKTAFQIGFIIYLPFLVIDMVTASVLMAMGMMMLPPVIISLPFKIMLFVFVDGWSLLVGSLVKSFG
jgi:flagellar biosynthetic protein FliP